jgi:adenosylcobinamide-phosphate synthase
LLIEAIVGYPAWLFRMIGHPITWIGSLLSWFDKRFNHDTDADITRRNAGILVLLAAIAAAVLPTIVLQRFIALPILMVLASSLFAQRSLLTHVSAVADALDHGGLVEGRRAVSHIVGRNPQALDEAGVVRAAIESLAENFSDAVVAPAFWCALAGLPGIAAYKVINTADSMIGHRTLRHAAFGWAAARFDDLVNLPASRLSALWLMLVSGRTIAAAWRAVWRDARHHRSPNAGWPEAAMAGALGLRLAGPRVYGETRVDDAWMGDGRADATTRDLRLAMSLYKRACALQIAVVLVLLIIVRG